MQIFSFFSFKGGVGRTALLANVGAHWASEGKVVLLIDLDLFAPGLTYSPLAGPPLEPQTWQGGISNLLLAFLQGGTDENEIDFLPPSKLIREMELPQASQKQGRLLLIDAGTEVNRVLTYPFSSQEENRGNIRPIPSPKSHEDEPRNQTALRVLASSMRQDLEDYRLPAGDRAAGRAIDYVLIDCRTGWAELQDLSLGYLADQMVVVSGLNHQNIRGLELTLDALKEDDRVPVDHFPALVTVVFSPVPAAEDEATLAALDHGHQVLGANLRMTRGGLRERTPFTAVIHYNPALALSDALLAINHPRALYAREIRRIAAILIGSSRGEDDELVQGSRHRNLKRLLEPKPSALDSALQNTVPAPPPARPGRQIAINADLPGWWWPLGNESEAQGRLMVLLPQNPALSINRNTFATILCHAPSLDIAAKKRILATFASLSADQLDTLQATLEEAQEHFLRAGSSIARQNSTLELFYRRQLEWATIVLGDERSAQALYLLGPVEGNSLFDAWEEIPRYWQLLARDLLTLLNNNVAARNALESALPLVEDLEALVGGFFDTFPVEEGRTILPEAAETLALEIAPDSERVRFWVGQSRWRKHGGQEDGRALIEPLLENPPKDGDLCHSILAFVLDEAKPLALRCESLARQAGESSSRASRAWFSFGNLLRDPLARFAEAEAAYRKAIELDSEDAYPWYNLGKLLTDHLARYAEAEAAYRTAIKLDPKDAYPWNNLGNLLQDHFARYGEAEDAYRKAIELDPKLAHPWNGLGKLLQDHFTRYAEAETAYRKAIELDPELAHPWNGLGNLLQNHLARYDEAEVAYRKASELDPKYAGPWNNLGNLLKDHLARYEEAEAAYRKASELELTGAGPWVNLGNLLQHHLARYDEAESAYRKASELDPMIDHPWNNLGLLKRRHGQHYTEAFVCFENGLKLTPNDPHLNMNLGHLLLVAGQRSTALPLLAGALQEFHKAADWTARFITIWLAMELNDREKLVAPRELWPTAPAARQKDADFKLAWVYLELILEGKDAALAAWPAALAALNNHSDRHEWLLDLYTAAVARPDLWAIFASFARDLLELPVDHLACFRDVAPPPEHLDVFRPFAEGIVTEPYDPRDPLFKPLEP